MFDTLLASNAGAVPWTRPAVAATILHVAVILRAVSGAASSPAELRPAARDTIRLEIGQLVKSERDKVREVGSPRPAPVIPGPPPVPDFALAGPPLETPPISYSPGDWSELSRSFLAGDPGDSSKASNQLRSILSVAEVDRLPELAEELRPRYPEVLRRANVSGEVQLEYVIQESGLVDRESIRVLTSTHPAFSEAAREALHRARFKPARRTARPVAVLVQQTVRFLSR